MDSFVLVAYASLAASRTLLQQLLACLNFILYSEDSFCWCKQKNDFYKLWQHHRLLKTMKMSEACPDTYNEGYTHQFQLNPLTKFTTTSRSTEFKDILPWKISQIITKTIPISALLVTCYTMKRSIPF